MTRSLRDYRHVLFAGAFVALLASASFTVVGEDQQAVIQRMGQPDRVANRFRADGQSGAGIVAKIPLVETVEWFPRGLVGFVLPDRRTKTADQQALLVDTAVAYRIIDPAKAARELGAAAKADEQVQTLLPAVIDQELGTRQAADVVRPGAGGANQAILAALDARARRYGIQVVDVRIARVQPDEAGRANLFERMRERHEASLLDIEVNSVRDAQAVTGAADAEATARRQASAAKDPEFYSFFRAMRSYDEMYGDPKRKNSTTIVLPPDSGYLKHFGGK